MNTLKGEFPKEGQYVLGKLKDKPWLGDPEDKEGNRFFVVVKFCKTEIEGNNIVPWYWDTFGPATYFGQDIEQWWDLQEITK